jgi:hypothetical protein
MGNVRSSPLATGTPIDRRHLDTARRPLRILCGILFVGYSSVGTIVGVRDDLAPALAGNPDAAIIGAGVGMVLALAIFLAEILLAESTLGWYLLVLAPDVWYTYWFSSWIGAIVGASMAPGIVADAVSIVITALFSLAVAYLGERLLFGKRR